MGNGASPGPAREDTRYPSSLSKSCPPSPGRGKGRHPAPTPYPNPNPAPTPGPAKNNTRQPNAARSQIVFFFFFIRPDRNLQPAPIAPIQIVAPSAGPAREATRHQHITVVQTAPPHPARPRHSTPKVYSYPNRAPAYAAAVRESTRHPNLTPIHIVPPHPPGKRRLDNHILPQPHFTPNHIVPP